MWLVSGATLTADICDRDARILGRIKVRDAAGNVVDWPGSGGTVKSKELSVSTTETQVDSSTVLAKAIVLLADLNNSDKIKVGASGAEHFPLSAGSSLALRHVRPSQLYAVAASGTQTLYIIWSE